MITDVTIQVDEQLVKQYERLVRFVTRMFCREDKPEFEDLLGWAWLGLIQAARQYNPQRGVKFSTFAFPRIVGCLKRALRFHRTMLHVPFHVSLPADLPDVVRFEDLRVSDDAESDSGDLDPLDALPASENANPADSATTRLIVQAALRVLNRTERQLVWLCLVEGCSRQEAAERCGITYGAARTMLWEARKKLRSALSDESPSVRKRRATTAAAIVAAEAL